MAAPSPTSLGFRVKKQRVEEEEAKMKEGEESVLRFLKVRWFSMCRVGFYFVSPIDILRSKILISVIFSLNKNL